MRGFEVASGVPGFSRKRWVMFYQLRRTDLVHLCTSIESAGDAVIVTDIDGRITYVNSAFERITGWSRDEALGHTPRILKNDATPVRVHRNLWETISKGRIWQGVLQNQRKDGTLYRVEQTIAPVMDHGQVAAYVSVHRDVTERNRVEAECREFAEEKLRGVEQELANAREIQQRLYPQRVPKVPGLDVAGAAFPADATCGDYFDFISLSDGRLNLVIGDVSGHGLGPAMLMVETRAALRVLLSVPGRIDEILSNLNTLILDDTTDQWFVTLFLACIESDMQTLRYVGAGHAAYLIRQGGVCEVLGSTGPPLGVVEKSTFSPVTTVRFEEGDSLLLITDGLTETQSPEGELLGADRMLSIFSQHTQEPAEVIVRKLYRSARDFAGGLPQADDITIVVARRI